jgi:predicted secreted protein
MKKMLVAIALALSLFSIAATAGEKAAPADDELIQIAILLDASNSMDGLIEQAKTQLWKIVNELIKPRGWRSGFMNMERARSHRQAAISGRSFHSLRILIKFQTSCSNSRPTAETNIAVR